MKGASQKLHHSRSSGRRELAEATAGSVALLLRSTVACSNLHMSRVLDCIGGVRVLVPLFGMLLDTSDLPPACSTGPDEAPADSKVDRLLIPDLLDHLLALLAEIVKRQPAKQQALLEVPSTPAHTTPRPF